MPGKNRILSLCFIAGSLTAAGAMGQTATGESKPAIGPVPGAIPGSSTNSVRVSLPKSSMRPAMIDLEELAKGNRRRSTRLIAPAYPTNALPSQPVILDPEFKPEPKLDPVPEFKVDPRLNIPAISETAPEIKPVAIKPVAIEATKPTEVVIITTKTPEPVVEPVVVEPEVKPVVEAPRATEIVLNTPMPKVEPMVVEPVVVSPRPEPVTAASNAAMNDAAIAAAKSLPLNVPAPLMMNTPAAVQPVAVPVAIVPEPVQPEPIKTEPIKVEPVHVAVEPAKVEPVKVETTMTANTPTEVATKVAPAPIATLNAPEPSVEKPTIDVTKIKLPAKNVEPEPVKPVLTTVTPLPVPVEVTPEPTEKPAAVNVGGPEPVSVRVLSLTGGAGMVQWQVNGANQWLITEKDETNKGTFTIRTGPDAGCELQVEEATRLRLGRLTRAELRMTACSDEHGSGKRVTVNLVRGVVYVTPAAGSIVQVTTPTKTMAVKEPTQISHDNAGTRAVSFVDQNAAVPTP